VKKGGIHPENGIQKRGELVLMYFGAKNLVKKMYVCLAVSRLIEGGQKEERGVMALSLW